MISCIPFFWRAFGHDTELDDPSGCAMVMLEEVGGIGETEPNIRGQVSDYTWMFHTLRRENHSPCTVLLLEPPVLSPSVK
jgi:hypothetical protein